MCRETCETCRETAVSKTADRTRVSRSQDALRRPRTLHLAVPGRPTHRPRTFSPSWDTACRPRTFAPSQDARHRLRTQHPSRDAFWRVPGRSSRPGTPATVPGRPDRPGTCFSPFRTAKPGARMRATPLSGRVLGRPRTPHPSWDAARRPGTLHPSGTPPKLSRDARTVPGRANPSQDAQTVPGHAQASRTHRHNLRPGGASWDAHGRRPRTPHLVPGRRSSLSDT